MMYGDDNVETDREDDRGEGEENEEEGKRRGAQEGNVRSDSLGGVSDHVRPPVGHGGSRIARDAGRHAAAERRRSRRGTGIGDLPTQGTGELRHDTMSRPRIPVTRSRRRPKTLITKIFSPLLNLFGDDDEDPGGNGAAEEGERVGTAARLQRDHDNFRVKSFDGSRFADWSDNESAAAKSSRVPSTSGSGVYARPRSRKSSSMDERPNRSRVRAKKRSSDLRGGSPDRLLRSSECFGAGPGSDEDLMNLHMERRRRQQEAKEKEEEEHAERLKKIAEDTKRAKGDQARRKREKGARIRARKREQAAAQREAERRRARKSQDARRERAAKEKKAAEIAAARAQGRERPSWSEKGRRQSGGRSRTEADKRAKLRRRREAQSFGKTKRAAEELQRQEREREGGRGRGRGERAKSNVGGGRSIQIEGSKGGGGSKGGDGSKGGGGSKGGDGSSIGLLGVFRQNRRMGLRDGRRRSRVLLPRHYAAGPVEQARGRDARKDGGAHCVSGGRTCAETA